MENFSTTTGQPTNAVYGFTAMLINVLRDETPTHIAVAFDLPTPTFRHTAYPAYKATRNETPNDFKGQVSLIHEVLEVLAIPSVSVAGYEADDVIATLATQGAAAGMDVLIVTGDRDAFQLVSDRVTVLYTVRGISDMGRYTPEQVQAKYDLTPAQYPDYAALRGDPSDNLPGIPGVGEKTAAKWVREFGSLDGLVDRVGEVKGKTGDALREHLADVIRNRTLTELQRDVPLDVGPARPPPRPVGPRQGPPALRHPAVPGPARAALRDAPVGRARGRPGLRRRRRRASGPTSSRPGWTSTPVPTAASASPSPARWGRGTGVLTGVALAAADGAAAFVDPTQLDRVRRAGAGRLARRPRAAQGAARRQGPAARVRRPRLAGRGRGQDTALAAYLALPGQRSFDLGDLALRYLRRELRAEVTAEGQLSFDSDDDSVDEQVAQAAMVKASAVLELAEALEADLERRGGTRLLREVELPLVGVLARMEITGIAADLDHLGALESRLGAGVKDAAAAAYSVVGREFNLGSPKQLQAILFDELNLPKTKKIKTGYTTDSDALQWLQVQSDHPLLEHLLRHRDVARLKSIVDSLMPMVDTDGRVHTTFNQMVAATGRLSSTDPNLQNIPIRTAEGREIRQAFVVGRGLRDAAHGRLQPDRDAHHGPPVRRRRG